MHLKMINVLAELWTKPCLMQPQMHKQICEVVFSHLDGHAHAAGGRADQFRADAETLAKGGFHYDEDSGTYCGFRAGQFAKDIPAGVSIDGGIATVFIHGIIAKRVAAVHDSSGVRDATDIEQAAAWVEASDEVDGVFLDIDSPGGSVTGTPEVAEAIQTITKPVVAYTDSLMASAAYWIGSQANAVYASASAQVGSIGVYLAWLDVTRQFEIEGIKTELIKRGKFKAMGLDGISLTDEQRTLLQDGVDEVHAWFVAAVTGVRADVPESAMEGQVFYATEAKNVGLIDAVGSQQDAMNALREMINAKPEDGKMSRQKTRIEIEKAQAATEAALTTLTAEHGETVTALETAQAELATSNAAHTEAIATATAELEQTRSELTTSQAALAEISDTLKTVQATADEQAKAIAGMKATLANPAHQDAAMQAAAEAAQGIVDAEADAAEKAATQAAADAEPKDIAEQYEAMAAGADRVTFWKTNQRAILAAIENRTNEE